MSISRASRQGTTENIEEAEALVNGCRSALRYSEFPTTVSFVVIWLYVLASQHVPKLDTYHMKAFIGGVVSFQLLFSNLMYVILSWPGGWPWATLEDAVDTPSAVAQNQTVDQNEPEEQKHQPEGE